MGWTRIAMIAVDDAWGRAFMGDATEAAAKVGVDLALSLVYSLGDAASIEDAVSRLAQSGVGIVLCTIFHSDLLSIAYAADSHGLLGDGFAWIVPHAVPVDAVAAQSPDPARARAVLQGWLASSSGLLRGAAGEAFYTVLANEPLENLNVSGLQGLVTPGLLQERVCDDFCAAIYDAVWTAAIAIAQVEPAANATLDKAALLAAVRAVSFDGASGRVQYDATGERDVLEVPFFIKNVRAVQPGGGAAEGIALVETWRLEQGAAVPVDEGSPPVWLGGQRAWTLPVQVLACPRGQVFSGSSLQCERCPPGTAEQGGACVRFHANLGVIVPLTWEVGGPVESWALPWAAVAALATYHVNHKVETLVPRARELLPADFRLIVDIKDSQALPTVAVGHAVQWNEQGTHAVIGSYRSAVTGPLALAASIEATPLIVWAASASSLADRSVYPTLSRTNIHDGSFAKQLVRSLQALGWNRAAIVYLDDEWGRGFSQNFGSAATEEGMEILISADFALGSAADTEVAVSRVGSTGARVILLVAYGNEVLNVYAAAKKLDLLADYLWVIPFDIDLQAVASGSADQEATRAGMVGWISCFPDPMYDNRMAWFQEQLASAPRHHLNHSGLEGLLGDGPGVCDSYCPFMYDAVWTVAIAVGRVGVAEDGSLDKAALLKAIREVEFEGASRQVRYDSSGERDESETPVILKNARAITTDDGRRAAGVAMVETWQWWPGESGGLKRVGGDENAPVWPGGGAPTWTVPPDRIICPLGTVLSQLSLECEACPPGTRPVISPLDNHPSCVNCPAGTHSFSAGPGELAVCQLCQPGSAAEEGAAECTLCPAGSAADAPGQERCTACPPGSAASERGQELCSPCGQASFQNATASTACRSCPAGMVTVAPNSRDEAACVCPVGSYLDGDDSRRCRQCKALWTTRDKGARSAGECELKDSTRSMIIAAAVCGTAVPCALLAAYHAMKSRVRKAEAELQRAMDSEMKRRLDAAMATLRDMNHSMVLLSSAYFLRVPAAKLRGLHETLRNEGMLVFLDCHEQIVEFKRAGTEILFFSYEWLSFQQPGPNDVQLAAMRAAALTFDRECKARGRELFIWLDIVSIPQISPALKDLAVNSLYAYASCADHMVIIAPDSRHANTGHVANLDTAASRVWLRAEQVSHMAHAGISSLHVQTQDSLEPVPAEWLSRVAPIFDGDMTCCRLQHPSAGRCDKEKLMTPILGLYYDLRCKALRGELCAERTAVLDHLVKHKHDVFPATFEYVHAGERQRRELFGDIISRADKHLEGNDDDQTWRARGASIDHDAAHNGPGGDPAIHQMLATLTLNQNGNGTFRQNKERIANSRAAMLGRGSGGLAAWMSSFTSSFAGSISAARRRTSEEHPRPASPVATSGGHGVSAARADKRASVTASSDIVSTVSMPEARLMGGGRGEVGVV